MGATLARPAMLSTSSGSRAMHLQEVQQASPLNGTLRPAVPRIDRFAGHSCKCAMDETIPRADICCFAINFDR